MGNKTNLSPHLMDFIPPTYNYFLGYACGLTYMRHMDVACYIKATTISEAPCSISARRLARCCK